MQWWHAFSSGTSVLGPKLLTSSACILLRLGALVRLGPFGWLA